VSAFSNHFNIPQQQVDDMWILNLQFANDVIGHVTVSAGCQRPYGLDLEVWGTKGTLVGDNTSPSAQMSLRQVDRYRWMELPKESMAKALASEMEHFVDCIVNDKTPLIDGVDGAKTVATAWAALVSMGEDGYLRATEAILESGTRIRDGIDAIEGLHVLGDPLWVIAFDSDDVNIYEVMARMAVHGWSLNGLHHPPAVHIAVTLRHTQPGVVDRFLSDLSDAVEGARADGGEPTTGAAPMYGMAATFPARAAVNELMTRYIDRIYEIEEG